MDLTEAYDQLAALIPTACDEPPAPFRNRQGASWRFNPVTAELAANLLMDQAELAKITDLLWERKQVILYGPPGTGKTYLATSWRAT